MTQQLSNIPINRHATQLLKSDNSGSASKNSPQKRLPQGFKHPHPCCRNQPARITDSAEHGQAQWICVDWCRREDRHATRAICRAKTAASAVRDVRGLLVVACEVLRLSIRRSPQRIRA